MSRLLSRKEAKEAEVRNLRKSEREATRSITSDAMKDSSEFAKEKTVDCSIDA